MSNQDSTTIDGWPFAQGIGVLVQSSYRTVPKVPGPKPPPRPRKLALPPMLNPPRGKRY